MDKPTLALLKCVIWWKIALTRRKDHWAKISHPFGLQKLPPWIKTPRNRANACSNSSGNCLIVSVKIPEYEKHLTPFHGTKLTKFKYDLTVKTPIAMQVNFCLTLVRFSYLSNVESVQTSDRCSVSQREASRETFITQRHLGLRDALSRGWISHYGWGSHSFCRVAEISLNYFIFWFNFRREMAWEGWKVPKKVVTRGYSNFCEGYIFDIEGKF